MAKGVAERLQVVDDVFCDGADHGVMLLHAEDEPLDGRTIKVDGREVVNFGSCSYLGLEMDPRLRQGVIDAVLRYGTQFSSSRSYVSAPPYQQLTGLLDELFGAPAMVASSTSLGHVATLPTIITEKDAIILDQQVHHSVGSAANQARVQGTPVEMIRHNRMDMLEERVAELSQHHEHVWYLADGVYSMFADFTPLDELAELLERYPKLHLYIDDSHGMSWTGPHGRGYVLGTMAMHDRMVVAASLNKAFACAGGAFIFPSEEMRRKVTTVGGPMVFSGPVQPPMLGAAIASARIHLSDEIIDLQQALQERVAMFNQLAAELGLPVISATHAPIRYVGVGLPRLAYRVAQRMMDDGFFVNVAPFPGVPMKQGGIRTPLNVHLELDDVAGMVRSLARHLPVILREGGSSIEQIADAFGIDIPANWPRTGAAVPSTPADVSLTLEHHRSIDELNADEWDRLLGDRGTFTAEGLRYLESTFRGPRPEDTWDFHYLTVRDSAGQPVLATFFTVTLLKDDMLAPRRVSARVEQLRADDPYFLTSRTLTMGSMLSEGEHLYLDRSSDWRQALKLMFDKIAEIQAAEAAQQIVLRDFADDDPEFEQFVRDHGFTKTSMLDSLVLDGDFHDPERWLQGLSERARRHQRREVLPFVELTETEVVTRTGRPLTDEELDHLYALYCNVQDRGLDLNVFRLPRHTFSRMLAHPCWEFVITYLKGSRGPRSAIAFGAHFVGPDHYCPMVLGLDYDYLKSHHIYRVALFQMIDRARQLGVRRVLMGMGATLEKRRFGARPHRRAAYIQADDHFHSDLLTQIDADTAGVRARPK